LALSFLIAPFFASLSSGAEFGLQMKTKSVRIKKLIKKIIKDVVSARKKTIGAQTNERSLSLSLEKLK
jgi:hypothetical protein